MISESSELDNSNGFQEGAFFVTETVMNINISYFNHKCDLGYDNHWGLEERGGASRL